MSGFDRASEIRWEDYYKAVEERSVRPLLIDALARLPDPLHHGRPLVAVDLGCGDGKETLAMLAAGWTVFAVDSSADALARVEALVPEADRPRLYAVRGPFDKVELPAADFIYAGLSLPFCAPETFDAAWANLSGALQVGGLFAAHLFGPNDSWANTPDMTFHSRDDLTWYLAGFDVHSLIEQDEDGAAANGPKHWHVFHVIATKLPTD